MLRPVFYKCGAKLLSLFRKVGEPPIPNYKGDRYIEYSFVAAHLPDGPGKALDFGCGSSSIGESWMGLLAARKGFEVTGLDLQPVKWLYEDPHLKFIEGDILGHSFRSSEFDLIINVSAIEHIGLAGSYGIRESLPEGDIESMRIFKNILRPGGTHILTIPVGQDRIFRPWHRVYGEERLPRILEGWEVVKEEYWIKNKFNRWVNTQKDIALRNPVAWYCYGLGLFVLRNPL